MKIISEELRKIAEDLDMIYVRAIDINDLNQHLQGIKIDKPILVYAGMSTVEVEDNTSLHENVVAETTVYVLNKHLSADPTAEQIDDLLAPLFDLANFVYDGMRVSWIVSTSADVERVSLQSTEAIELTDENIGGWELKLNIPMERKVYYCPEGPPLTQPQLLAAYVSNTAPDRFVMRFNEEVFAEDHSGWRLFVNGNLANILAVSPDGDFTYVAETDITVLPEDILWLDYIDGTVKNAADIPLANIYDFEVENNVQGSNSPEADAVIASMPNALTQLELDAIPGFVNTFSNSMGNDQWNSHIDSFPHFGLLDPVNAMQDWKREIAMVNNGAVHVPGIGFDFDGAAAFIDSNYNPAIDGVHVQDDNINVGCFVISDRSTGNTRVMLGINNGGIQINLSKNISDQLRIILNQSAIVTTTVTESNDILFSGIRSGSNNIAILINTVMSVNSFQEPLAIPIGNLYIGARNDLPASNQHWDGLLSSYLVSANIDFDHEHYYLQLQILNETLAGVVTQTLTAV